jgi:hypothetical protein
LLQLEAPQCGAGNAAPNTADAQTETPALLIAPARKVASNNRNNTPRNLQCACCK